MDATSQTCNQSESPKDSSSTTPQGAKDQIAVRRVGLAPFLLLVVLCQCAVLIWLVRQDPLALLRISSLLHPAPAAPQRPKPDRRLMAQDPALGSELPTHDVGVSTRRSVGGAANGYLLVPIGDCAGCISADIRAWQAAAPQSGVKLVLLTSAGEDAIQKFRSGLGLHVPIVSDQKGSLIRSLNVLWPGRAYLYSPKWRLIWLQRDDRPRSDPFKDKGFLAALQEER